MNEKGDESNLKRRGRRNEVNSEINLQWRSFLWKTLVGQMGFKGLGWSVGFKGLGGSVVRDWDKVDEVNNKEI